MSSKNEKESGKATRAFLLVNLVLHCVSAPLILAVAYYGISNVWRGSGTRASTSSRSRSRSRARAARQCGRLSWLQLFAMSAWLSSVASMAGYVVDGVLLTSLMRGFSRQSVWFTLCRINRALVFVFSGLTYSSVLCFFFERLVVTFADASSALRVSARTQRVFFAWSALLLLWACVIAVSVAQQSDSITPMRSRDVYPFRHRWRDMTVCEFEHVASPHFRRFLRVSFWFFVASISLCNCLLGLAYYSRLSHVLARRRALDDEEAEDSSESSESKVQRRVFVIAVVSVLSTLLLFASSVLVNGLFGVIPLDLAINCACVLCSFQFAHPYYSLFFQCLECR